MGEKEKQKMYQETQSLMLKMLEKGHTVDNNLLASQFNLIRNDVTSSDEGVRNAAFAMLDFLLALKSDEVQRYIIKILDDGLQSKIVQKVILKALKKKLTQTIMLHQNITELLLPWKNQNFNKLTSMMEDICLNIPKDTCKFFFLNEVIPAVMLTNTDNELRDILIDMAFILSTIIPVSDLSFEELELFLKNVNIKYITSIGQLRDKDYPNWHSLWIFLVRFCDKNIHNSMDLTNKLLRVVEYAFRNYSVQQRLKGYDCWKELIDNASLDMTHMCSPKQIKLLITPLKAKFSKQEVVINKRFDVFTYLLEKLQHKAVLCVTEFLEFCFGTVGDEKDPSRMGQAKGVAQIRAKSAKALVEIIGHSHGTSVDCLSTEDVIKLEKPLINQTNLQTYYKIIIHSVGECCILLKEIDIESKREKVIKCMWKAIFNLVIPHSQVNTVAYFQAISNVLEGYIEQSSENPYFEDVLVIIFTIFVSYNRDLIHECVQYILIQLLRILFTADNIPSNVSDCFSLVITHSFSKIELEEEKLKMVKVIMSCLTQLKPNDENVIGAAKIWLCLAGELISDLTVENIQAFEDYENFFMWPAYNLHYLSEHSKKQVILLWMKLYRKMSDEEDKKLYVIKVLENIFKNNPLLASNVVSLLNIISQFETKFSKEFVLKLMDTSSKILLLPNLKAEDEQKLTALVMQYFEPTLECYKTDDHEVIKNICTCIEHILCIHESFKILDSFGHFLSSSSVSIRSKFSTHLSSLLFSIYHKESDLNSYNAKEVFKVMAILKDDAKKGEKEKFMPPSGRSARIAHLAKKYPKSPQLKNSPKSPESKTTKANSPATLRLFGQDPETMSPVHVKGSQLNNTPSRSNKIYYTSKSKLTHIPSINDEKSSDFVPIDTEITFQPSKLSEHQKEVLKKRREDIPALYQDLSQSVSQDIFSSRSNSKDTKNNDDSKKQSKVIVEVMDQQVLVQEETKLKEDLQKSEGPEITDGVVEDAEDDKLARQNVKVKSRKSDFFADATQVSDSKPIKAHAKGNNNDEAHATIKDTKEMERRKKIELELQKLRMDIVGADKFVVTPKRTRPKEKPKEADENSLKKAKNSSSPKTVKTRRRSVGGASLSKSDLEENSIPLELPGKVKDKLQIDTPKSSKKKSLKQITPMAASKVDDGKQQQPKKKRLKLNEETAEKKQINQFDSSKKTVNLIETTKISKRKNWQSNETEEPSKSSDTEYDLVKRNKKSKNAKKKEQIAFDNIKKTKDDRVEKGRKEQHIEQQNTGPDTIQKVEVENSKANKTKMIREEIMQETEVGKEKTEDILVSNEVETEMIREEIMQASEIGKEKTENILVSNEVEIVKMKNIEDVLVTEEIDIKTEVELAPEKMDDCDEVLLDTESVEFMNEDILITKEKAKETADIKDGNQDVNDKRGEKRKYNSGDEESEDIIESSQESHCDITPLMNLSKKTQLKVGMEKHNSLEEMTMVQQETLTSADFFEDVAKVNETVEEPVIDKIEENATVEPAISENFKNNFDEDSIVVEKIPADVEDVRKVPEDEELKENPPKEILMELPKDINTTQDTTITEDSSVQDQDLSEAPNTTQDSTQAGDAVPSRIMETQDTLTQPSQTQEMPTQSDNGQNEDSNRPPVLYFDLPKKPELTESEQIMCRMDTMSICTDPNNLEKQNQVGHHQSLEEIEILSDLAVDGDKVPVADILGTPSTDSPPSSPSSVGTPHKSSSIQSSPITVDTPTRTSELLKSTFDISPISSFEGDISGEISVAKSLKFKANLMELEGIEVEINMKEQEENTDEFIQQDDAMPDEYKDASQQNGEFPQNGQSVNVPEEDVEIIPEGAEVNMYKISVDSTDLVTCQNVRDSSTIHERSSKLLNMLKGNSPGYQNKLFKKRRGCSSTASPSTGRIWRLMSSINHKPNHETIDDVNEHDILTFSREVPSPLAVPKTSILKRKLSDTTDSDGISPCPKRKRVNFSDPCLTSKKIFLRDDYQPSLEAKRLFDCLSEPKTKDDHFKDIFEFPDDPCCSEQLSETENIETEQSLEITNPLILRKDKPIYPKLADCTEDVLLILKRVTSPMFITMLMNKLKSKDIKTIGDLARQSEAEINRFPFKVPVIANVYKALDNYYKKKGGKDDAEFEHKFKVNGIVEDDSGTIANYVVKPDVRMEFKRLMERTRTDNVPVEDLAKILLPFLDKKKTVTLMKEHYQLSFEDYLDKNDFKHAIKYVIESVGITSFFRLLHGIFDDTDLQEDYFDCITNYMIHTVPLARLLRGRSMEDLQLGLQESLEQKLFEKQEVIETCFLPLIENPRDICSYLNNISMIDLENIVITRLQSENADQFLEKILEAYPIRSLQPFVEKLSKNNVIASEDLIISFQTCINAQTEEKQSEIMVEMFKFISSKLDLSTLIDLHVDFLKRVPSILASKEK